MLVEPFGEALGGHGVPGVGFIPALLELPLLWLLLPGVVELEVDPGVELEELLLLFVPGRGPHGPLFGCVPFGVAVEGVLPGVEPGVVLLGVVFGAVLGVALGVVLGVLGVEPGVVLCGVVCGVVVPGVVVAPGVDVLPGVVDPGAVLCPADPVELLELPGDVPPAGALWANAQLPQPRTTESRINLFLDICICLRTFRR